MSFHVICLETGEPLKSDEGVALLFPNGSAAACVARETTALSGKKHQPRPVLDDGWQTREAQRLSDGTYTRVPWDCLLSPGDRLRSWWYTYRSPEAAHHYAHVSVKHPGSIAFTESAEKGAADIQTTMKIGRYLTQFYGHRLIASDIRSYANEYLSKYAKLKLSFATTADEIERVYVNGPRSCMSHAASDYASKVHPVRVYAAGDLAVAYMTAEDEDNHITARVLCWPDKKLFSRIYGDEDKLEALLRDQGYRPGELEGARLLKIRHHMSDCFVMPYIDDTYAATDAGEFLQICDGGELKAEQTNGLSSEVWTCPHCGESADPDSTSYVEGEGESWCESCVDNDTFYCEHYEDTRTGEHQQVCVRDRRGNLTWETWCEQAVENDAFRCDGTGDYYHNDLRVELHDGTEWSEGYFEDNGHMCEHCEACGPADWKCDCEQEENTETESEEETQAPQASTSAPVLHINDGDTVTVCGDPDVADGAYVVRDRTPMDDSGIVTVYDGTLSHCVYRKHITAIVRPSAPVSPVVSADTPLRVGDRVTWADTQRARAVIAWRNRTHGYPPCDVWTVIKHYQRRGHPYGDTVDVQRPDGVVECWECDAFKRAPAETLVTEAA